MYEDRFETDFAQTEQMNSSDVSKDVALYIARKHLFPERARTANVSSTIQVVKSNHHLSLPLSHLKILIIRIRQDL